VVAVASIGARLSTRRRGSSNAPCLCDPAVHVPTPSPSDRRAHAAAVSTPTLDGELDRSEGTGGIGRGTIVGRYVVLARLGAGGMGVVYDAYDPELARKLAIKVLHPAARDRGERAGRRLLREAQALARLSHPNVVAIHDVGMIADNVWIAMEFVDGQTLSAWNRAAQRKWPEVVEVMIDAGRGLARAHEAGLVHRDFKPDNVMVGADGRVRVMDFGLARHGTADPSRADSDVIPAGGAKASTEPRSFGGRTADASPAVGEHSVAGEVVGTPGYMSPEQYAGLGADARSDQFAFCVTLWECLYGKRPFSGKSTAALATAVMAGTRDDPPRGVAVPAWLRRVCERGLATEAGRRFPSMDALLDALERGKGRMRTRRVVVALLGAGALATAIVVRSAIVDRRAAQACTDAGDAIVSTWPGEQAELRDAVHDAMLRAAPTYAPQTTARVVEGIDAYADAWRDVRTTTCLARRDAAPEPRIDECLEERRVRLAAVVDRLAHADREMVVRAAQVVASLTAAAPCGDPSYIALRPSLPAGAADRVHAVDATIADTLAQVGAGDFAGAIAGAERAVAEATEIGWTPLLADANLALARAAHGSEAYDREREALVAAYLAGGTAGVPETTASAATALIENAIDRDHIDEAAMWANAAQVASASLPEGDVERIAQLTLLRGQLALAQGDPERAKTLVTEALALREGVFGVDAWPTIRTRTILAEILFTQGDFPGALAEFERVHALNESLLGRDHPSTTEALGNLGVVRFESGDNAGAKAIHQQTVATLERTLGDDHSLLSSALVNLGNVLSRTGEHREARALRERALAINERLHGREHRVVAGVLIGLAIDEMQLGDAEKAKTLLLRAIAIMERSLGVDHPDLVPALASLGSAHDVLGDLDAAVTTLERAVAIVAARLGPEHVMVATLHNNLGSMERKRDRDAVAREHYAKAMKLWEGKIPPEHPYFGFAHAGLGDLELRAHAYDAARDHFTKALALYEAAGIAAGERADVQLGLAKALWAKGEDRERARELAADAEAGYRAADSKAGLADVAAFMKAIELGR
jgi:tetratricopeptide (TPR) repeat protein/predicted Ser/Thr protein kinase